MAGELQVAGPLPENRTIPSVQIRKLRVPVVVEAGVAEACQASTPPRRPKRYPLFVPPPRTLSIRPAWLSSSRLRA